MAGLAVFDLDRTIVRFGTYTPFLLRYAVRHAPWRLLFAPVVLVLMVGYKLGLLDRGGLKERMFRLLIGRPTMALMDEVSKDFADHVVTRHCFKEAVEAVARHRQAGDTLILATASFAFYARHIADRLGFDHTVGTLLEESDGRLHPRIRGGNCYGPEKKSMVLDFLSRTVGEGASFIFYTDDKSDIPLLDVAAAGILVNPKKYLAEYGAARANMQIVRWQ